MAIQRIKLTPAEVRSAIDKLHVVNLSFAQSAIAAAPDKSHVSAEQAVMMAIELLGLTRVIELIKRNGDVVIIWMTVLEEIGWGRGSVNADVQFSILTNSIKSVVNREAATDLKKQELVVQLIKTLDIELSWETFIVQKLLSDKQINIPWVVLCSNDTL
ncbi:hypothetical protein LUCX_316 [Xanthomonas phage vB_XciM_LucasX]|nr:hypothetical protein LUCX_316 [Xanthomonas phage vB_XciM_LucasX]